MKTKIKHIIGTEEMSKKVLEGKINQFEKDLKIILKISKLVDKIKTANIKARYEEHIVQEIKELIEKVKDLKDFLQQEPILYVGGKKK